MDGSEHAAVARAQRPRLDALAASFMLVLVMLWGVQQVTTKIAIAGGMPPLFQAAGRSVIASVLLLGWAAWRRQPLFARDGTLWPGVLVALLFGGEFALLFPGVARTSASHAVVLLYTAPFFTALGAHLLLPAERLTPVRVAGLLLAFVGVAVAAYDRSAAGSSWVGDLLVVGGAAGYGLTTVVLKASPALMRATTAKVFFWQVGGSVPLLVLTAAAGGQAGWPRANTAAWLALGYQGAVVTFASYMTWFWLVARYPAGRLASFTFLTPLVGIAAAGVFLHEPVTPQLLGGVAFVLIGLRLVNLR